MHFPFDGKVCPHTQTARLAGTVVSHCGHTFFRRLSLSIGQPPLSAYNAWNLRVLIASSKKYFHQKRPEVCSGAALTRKMKPWPLNSAIYGEKHVIIVRNPPV